MKKVLLFITSIAILFTACNKENQKDVEVVEEQVETSIEFKIEQTGFDFKNEVPQCSELSMDYVKFIVRDSVDTETEYKTSTYTIGEELLTQVIKLPVGTYHVTSFLVYNDNDTPADESDDILVRAAPEIESEYWDLMQYKLDLEFSIDAFYKKQIDIDVLCFEELFYQEFGFTWFQFHDVRIERQCYFGDICTGKLQDFYGSIYEDQPEGVQMDMPAIFEIKVYKDFVVDNDDGQDGPELLRTFTNLEYLGVGQCLEVYWPNRLDETEQFSFELWVWLPSGEGFEYRHIHTWTFMDENGPDAGEDGVVEFVIGSCQFENSDFNFPFWMDLPVEPFNMHVGTQHSPGAMGTYFDITLSGIPAGYDIGNETYGIWCGDKDNTINLGSDHTVIALNSLSSTLPGDLTLTRDQINNINYFFNALPNLIDGFDYYDTELIWSDIQNTIWALAGDITPTGTALTYYNHVMIYGPDYEVPPGGWAAIIFWEKPTVQLVFMVVDP